MQRIVTDPAGTSWDVHVEWIGRRVATDTMLGRFRRRRQQRVHRRRALAAEAEAKTDAETDDKPRKWHDNLDLPDPGGCVDAAAASLSNGHGTTAVDPVLFDTPLTTTSLDSSD